jgi:hypothetical protein
MSINGNEAGKQNSKKTIKQLFGKRKRVKGMAPKGLPL